MPKMLVNIRVESEQVERLRNIAALEKKTVSKLVREKITEVIQNGYSVNTKFMAAKIVKELRQPFAYVKVLESEAKKEREAREQVALKLIEVFHL